MTQPVPDPGFLADVRRAARVWRGNPVVPLLYLLFAITTFVERSAFFSESYFLAFSTTANAFTAERVSRQAFA